MASSDIQPLLDSQPPLLPFNVARVTADGRPTTHLLDWEAFQAEWYRSGVIKTDQRITEVKAVADNASAAVTEETNARVSADAALAEQITEVAASVDDATANGEIYFAAMAGPTGSIAAYGIFLKAGNAFTGMQLIAESGGGASIGFAATDFRLVDSGTAQPVFNYTGGVFTFNVPVRVGTIDIANQAVNAPVYVSSSGIITVAPGGGWVPILTATATGAPGSIAVVHADLNYRKVLTGSGSVGGTVRLRRGRDGSILYSAPLQTIVDFSPLYTIRFDPGFSTGDSYTLEAGVTSGDTAYFEFANCNILVDVRKR